VRAAEKLAGLVGETADALVVLRSGARAERLGVADPYARWFVTGTGVKLCRMARRIDPVYREYNLARYLHTTSRLRALAPGFEQALFLGAGFDFRALTLPELAGGRLRVFEVDAPEKLDLKRRGLEARGISLPSGNRYVPARLERPGLRERLALAGLDPSRPVLVLAEGVLFYMPARVTAALLAPSFLGLAPGSRWIFDCWTKDRVEGLNARLAAAGAAAFFRAFPWKIAAQTLPGRIRRLGYRTVEMAPLEDIARRAGLEKTSDDFSRSWWLVEAAV